MTLIVGGMVVVQAETSPKQKTMYFMMDGTWWSDSLRPPPVRMDTRMHVHVRLVHTINLEVCVCVCV